MRRRPTSRYRLVGLAAMFLAAGAVLDIGVAWTAAAETWLIDRNGSSWRKKLRPGEWPDVAPDGWPQADLYSVRTNWLRTEFSATGPSPARYEDSSQWMPRMLVTDCGWPMRSLTKTEIFRAHSTMDAFRTGIRVPLGRREVNLPINPLPHGFAVNTVFYAGALALIAFGPGAIVRARRRRTGMCVACAYSRAGLGVDAPCPECGMTA